MQRVVAVDVARILRPRTDERHLAADDVPQLRQLVELRPPQEPAEPRDPRVAGRRDPRAGRCRPDAHRAQLVERELAVRPDPACAMEGGPGRGQPDGDARATISGDKEHQADRGDQPPERPSASDQRGTSMIASRCERSGAIAASA